MNFVQEIFCSLSAFIVGPTESPESGDTDKAAEEVGDTDRASEEVGATDDTAQEAGGTEEAADEDGRTNKLSEEVGGADILFEEVGVTEGIDINNFKGKIVRKDHGKKIIEFGSGNILFFISFYCGTH